MEFKEFKTTLQKNIEKMLKDIDHLFVVELNKDALYNKYLDSFPAGSNEIFRERRENDCSCCRHFIKAFGNVVTIKNNKVTTIWDFNLEEPRSDITPVCAYQVVIDAMDAFVKSHKVSDVFITKLPEFGVDKNFEEMEDKSIRTWEHMYIKLPKKFVNTSSDTVGSVMSNLRAIKEVFQRSLEEISEDAVQTVLELIAQNSLYKGEEWEAVLKQFLKYEKDFVYSLSIGTSTPDVASNNYCWEKSLIAGPVIGKIRNHSIGTLLTDISEGVELNEAVRKYEAIVAPSNYRRSQPIYTKQMLERAHNKLEELGYIDSLERRYATLDDITVNNILFANRDSIKKMSGAKGIFEDMVQDIAVNPKKFDKTEEILISDFIKDVLPTVKNMEVLLENKHSGNMVSLIAPKIMDSKTMFKWDNGFSWAYSGNITDSMKERVKAAGGNIEGVLRFSIQWNDKEFNGNDFDAHCIEPNRNEIYFSNKCKIHPSSGMLDVDIVRPIRGTTAVENITWSDKSRLQEGEYLFFVRNFSHNGGRTGFTAEIEFDGQIYSFDYNKELRHKEDVEVAKVTFSRKTEFKIETLLPSSTSSRSVWGLTTNQFHPVSVVMNSPNYWNLQEGIGHKHYFIMLKDCINPEMPNAFYNEFLNQELNEYRKVMEALGSKLKVDDCENQLSGLGFSSTKRNSLVVKIEGKVSRMLKINF
jgi:hypothetical protein